MPHYAPEIFCLNKYITQHWKCEFYVLLTVQPDTTLGK